MKTKFDAQDREQTIAEIESHLDVKLRPIGRRQKYLIDTNLKRYWILGGYGHWHGIPASMMDAEACRADKGSLFIAVRKTTGINIFRGSVQSLVSGRERLSRNGAGDYQLLIDERGRNLHVRELPSVKLTWFAKRDYSTDQKAEDRASFLCSTRLKSLFSKLSNEEKVEFMNELRIG
jgi:hypothetical protein